MPNWKKDRFSGRKHEQQISQLHTNLTLFYHTSL